MALASKVTLRARLVDFVLVCLTHVPKYMVAAKTEAQQINVARVSFFTKSGRGVVDDLVQVLLLGQVLHSKTSFASRCEVIIVDCVDPILGTDSSHVNHVWIN